MTITYAMYERRIQENVVVLWYDAEGHIGRILSSTCACRISCVECFHDRRSKVPWRHALARFSRCKFVKEGCNRESRCAQPRLICVVPHRLPGIGLSIFMLWEISLCRHSGGTCFGPGAQEAPGCVQLTKTCNTRFTMYFNAASHLYTKSVLCNISFDPTYARLDTSGFVVCVRLAHRLMRASKRAQRTRPLLLPS